MGSSGKDMDWLVRTVEGRLEVRVQGDCDLYRAPAFAAEMLRRIAGGARNILFDLGGLVYLDSTGVGAIIRILQAAKRTGGEVAFRGLRGSPRRVLEMSGMLHLLRETKEE